MCGGDPERVKAFLRRLMMAAGEQLALKLTEPIAEAPAVVPVALKPKKKRKRVRRAT
jgi:hypothetical protein